MSHFVDRSLGVKPYNNAGGTKPVITKKKWSLKLRHVLVAMAILCGGVALYSTSSCQEGVRCAD